MKERHNWGGYYTDGNVNSEYIEEKKKIVTGYLERVKPGVVWDLGANIGSFSRIPAVRGIPTVSFDSDLQCVEQSYMAAKGEHLKTLLPLFMDITNPSPASGWEHSERKSLLDRGPADLALALALVHHLAISNNLPFEKIASFFQRICSSLVVEFIPRQDPMVEKLLNSRKEPPWDYSQSAFEAAFRQHFRIERSQTVAETQRRLYLMKKKRGGL
jgi:hypothetical protein